MHRHAPFISTTTLSSLAGLLFASLLSGCGPAGPQRAEVTGTVQHKGQPVVEGAINFFPTEGTKGPEAGASIKDGKFHIPRSTGPVVGKNRVVLTEFGFTGREIQDPTAPPGTLMKERANIMPDDVSKDSKLVREVKAGRNEFDFDIK